MNRMSNTAEEILASARTLIIAGGYNGFSYADIAGVVGIRKASIHHHFPNKVDLVKALVVQHRKATEEGIAALRQAIPEPMEQLGAYVQYWAKCIEDRSAPFCVCALLAGELPMLPQEVAVEVRSYFRFLSAWMESVLEQGMQQGTIRSMHAPALEAQMFMAMVHGAMLSARAYDDVSMFGTIVGGQLKRYQVRP